MTAFVVVETLDFVEAARSLSGVGDPVADAGFGLVDALGGCAAMSGSDPGGLSWAQAYDRAAGPAVRAVLDVGNGCYRLADLCAQTARNYDLAEAASSARSHAVRDAAVAGLPGSKQVDVTGGPPSAAGGSGDTPTGWSLISTGLGYVWPNGHQDRLRRAAGAWRHAGSVLDSHAFTVSLASVGFARDRLPEYEDVHAACAAMTARMSRLARVCQSLAQACEQLAGHIDTVHQEVRSELVKLGVESIGIQVVGAGVSALTVGIAEAPTQGVQAAKIAAVAAAVASKIEKFLDLARALAAQVSIVAADAARLAGELRGLRDLRVVAVSVHGVGTFPAIVRAREGASIMRMERAAAGAPNVMVARARGRIFVEWLADEQGELANVSYVRRWNSEQKLTRHFRDHAADFGITSRRAYVKSSAQFLQRAIKERLPIKVQEDGDILAYDPATNTFAVYTKHGLCRTYFKPNRGINYWDDQEGLLL